MDWSTTLLDVGLGVPHPKYPIDGVSLASILREPDRSFERPLYWCMDHRGQRALRRGDWKYLQADGHEYLFNILTGERERANLARQHPDRLVAMRHDWLAWDATLPTVPEGDRP